MARRIIALTLCAGFLLLPLQLRAAPAHDCHGPAPAEPPEAAAASAQSYSAMEPTTHAGHASAGHAGHAGHAAHASAGASARAVAHEHPADPHPAAAAPTWEVEGRYLDACRCNAPCPCHFGIGADYDSCDPTLVFHITAGHFEGARLDGLTAVVVTTGGKARLYLDDRGDPGQRHGLEEVARALAFTLLSGGFRLPADQVVTARSITAEMSDDHASITIPDALELRADRLAGGDGESRITLRNLDLGPSWMTEAWAGRSAVYRYSDAATWDFSGRNAYFGRFAAAAPSSPR